MAWGKVTRFLRVLSRTRVSRYPEIDPWWNQVPPDNSGWEYTAMHYISDGAIPGNHP